MNDAYIRRAELIHVVDGDTVDLRVDLGFRVFAELRFRLIGIDTPELTGPTRTMGRMAREALIDQLEGKVVTVESLGEPDKYGGRWDGKIRFGELDIATNLLTNGYALPYDGKGPRPQWSSIQPYPLVKA